MQVRKMTRMGSVGLGVACAALALSACSKKPAAEETAATPAATDVAATPAEAPAAAPAAATKVAADNTDTVAGVKFASYTGDAKKGEADFITCKTCHALDVNKIGPMLKGIVGRKAGTVAGYTYSVANRDSGITWSEDKLFQYLENPQRIVPGTKMTFAGWPTDPQKRADVIAYLKANS